MAADKLDGQVFLAQDESAAQSQTGATLENVAPKLHNAKATMGVRIPELGAEFKQREHRAVCLVVG